MKMASDRIKCRDCGYNPSAAIWLTLVFFCAVFLLADLGHALSADRRVAFVVGNGIYQSVPQLTNPRFDAEAVSAALKKSGFEVITAIDLDRIAFDAELQRFIRTMQGSELSVFYYSGHGLQVAGENRIVPTDSALKQPSDLEVETVSVNTILSYMRANSKVQLIYLDSCRNNPFPATSYLVGTEKSVSVSGLGLAPQESPLGSLTAYSTQPGALAVDGSHDKSPFTESVLAHSFKLGVDVKTALQAVTDDVVQSTAGRQKPWTSSALVKPLFLARPAIRIVAANQAVAEAAPAVKIGAAPSQDATDAGNVQATAPAAQPNQFAALLSDALAQPRRVPIGVGQIAMLDSIPMVRAANSAQIEFTSVPKSGVLYLDGKALGAGDKLDQESLRKVTFEPAMAAQNGQLDFELRIIESDNATPVSMTGKIQTYFIACDEEAGEPLDLQGAAHGKASTEINPATAVPACTDAVQLYPAIARYKYELGRAKLAAKDPAGASQMFKLAADAGYLRAESQLGQQAQSGDAAPIDYHEANKYLKVAAEQGDPFALLTYGRNLVFGNGIEKNAERGTQLISKAVEMGNAAAMNELGSMYFYGRGVKRNPERGLRFYKAAVSRGDASAMASVGSACLQGGGGSGGGSIQKDPLKALALFLKASEKGNAKAPADIASMYLNGTGVPKDIDAAVKWYQIGADRGDAWAAEQLALIYSASPSKLLDLQKAVRAAALAVALDNSSENPKYKAVLKALPADAKQKAIKELITEVGAANAQSGADLDETLVLLSRQAWRNSSPMLSQF